MRYIPDYPDKVLPERFFFYSILATLFPNNTKGLIKTWRMKRAVTENQDQQEMIEAVPQVLEEINSLLLHPSKSIKIYLHLLLCDQLRPDR